MADTIDRNDLKIYFGGAIKAAADGLIEGMGVPYTSPEIRDLHSEYFDTETDHVENDFRFTDARIHYNHGLDEKMSIRNIGKTVKAERSEAGVWLQAQLNMADEYEQMIYEMAQNGKLHWSSGALPQSVIVDGDGHIKRWAIIEFSLTPTPAMPHINRITTTKSLFLNQQTDSVTGRKGSNGYKDDTNTNADDETPIDSVNDIPVKDETMDENMIRQIIRMVLEEAKAGMPDEELPAEEEAVASVSADIAKAEGDMEEEEMAKAVAEKAWSFINAKMAAREKAFAAVRNVSKQNLATLKAQPATQSLPAFSGGTPRIDNRAGMGGIIEHSPYKHWSAEDFSFALALKHLSQGKGKRVEFDATPAFYQEFADKAIKGYNENKLSLQPAAFKSIQAIKANEVQHSTLDAYGDEWVPTIWADTIWEKPRLDNVVQNIFKSIEMPSNPYEYPVESTDPSVYLVAETTAEAVLALDITTSPIPDSRVGTDKVTFSAKKFGLRVMWSGELQEDAIARLVPQFRAQAERAIQNTIDNAAINGDTSTTTNINSDGETITDATRPYLAYDGLIHQPLVTATTNRLDANGAAPTLSMLRTIRSYLGAAEGRVPSELALIVDFPTYMKLLSDDNVVTVDKYGSAATVLTGELGRIDGVPVFVSDQMALADADGKVTQTSNTVNRGRAILVHRATWMMGFRRRIQQSLDYLPWYDTWVLTMTLRNDFKPRTASDGTLSSSDNSTAILYNIGV